MSDAPRIQLKRVGLALGAIVVFVGVARVIQPGESSATEMPTATPTVIGTLVGPKYHVRITGGGDDPRYTVLTPQGEVLEEDLLAHEVYHFFPDLDVTNLHFGGDDTVTGPLMMVDTD